MDVFQIETDLQLVIVHSSIKHDNVSSIAYEDDNICITEHWIFPNHWYCGDVFISDDHPLVGVHYTVLNQQYTDTMNLRNLIELSFSSLNDAGGYVFGFDTCQYGMEEFTLNDVIKISYHLYDWLNGPSFFAHQNDFANSPCTEK